MQRRLRKDHRLSKMALGCGSIAFVCVILTFVVLLFREDEEIPVNNVISGIEESMDEWSSSVNQQLWVVNDRHTLPFSYEPAMLVPISDSNVMLVNEAATAFSLMVNAMDDPVVPANGYISAVSQQNLYDVKTEEYRQLGYSEERMALLIRSEYMPGGQDEHQLGLTVDVCADNSLKLDYDFQKTEQGQWLLENSWKYGYVFRDQGETDIVIKPWQLRYVGKVHAQIMHELEYSLEEYLGYLEEQEIYYVSSNDENLVIYFKETLEGIPHKIKDVTGDNAGHYIVTCYQ